MWLNYGLLHLPEYRGECTYQRLTQNQQEEDYYQLGKVFRNQNIILTRKVTKNQKFDEQIDGGGHGTLLRFFVYTVSGREVPKNILLENHMNNE